MSNLNDEVNKANEVSSMNNDSWGAIDPNYVARMRLQNKFKTGIDVAKYTAAIMRKDMDAYDANPESYTQSLGCWHGFIGQQKLISIKKHFWKYGQKISLSFWMDGCSSKIRFWPPS